jgi:hypothetical protein
MREAEASLLFEAVTRQLLVRILQVKKNWRVL